MKRQQTWIVIAVFFLGGHCMAHAGSLEPPGPPAPTMKTLEDIEPRTPLRNDFDTLTPIVISEAGSYYLAENIFALFGNHGIEITASNVTLDLNGFTIFGNTEVGSLRGIFSDNGVDNVVVRNGTVRDFFEDGVYLSGSHNMVQDVRAIFNGLGGSGYGIRVFGVSRIEDCLAVSNIEGGLSSQGGVISGSGARQNAWGISSGGVVTHSVAEANTGAGISVSFGGVVTNSSSRNNDKGITASQSLVRGNATVSNTTQEIDAGINTTVIENNP